MLPTGQNTGPGAVASSADGTPEDPKANLRDLSRWMQVIGVFEVLAGSAFGVLWLLVRLRQISSTWLDTAAPEWRAGKFSAMATLGFGLLTLRAGAAVRRAARAGESLPPETAGAVERLKDLFEAQGLILLLVVALAVLSVLF